MVPILIQARSIQRTVPMAVRQTVPMHSDRAAARPVSHDRWPAPSLANYRFDTEQQFEMFQVARRRDGTVISRIHLPASVVRVR